MKFANSIIFELVEFLSYANLKASTAALQATHFTLADSERDR